MNKTERLELENKILRGMLSDIRKSIQKLDKASTTSSEERIRETYRMIGCIRHIAVASPTGCPRRNTAGEIPREGRHESTSDNRLPGSCSISRRDRKPKRRAAAGSHRDYDCVPGGAADYSET